MTKNKSKIIFGIGSNLNDRKANITKSIQFLTKDLNLSQVKSSKFYENDALLKQDSPPEWNKKFFNIALSAKFDKEIFNPEEILKIIKDIEIKIGRKPSQIWSPREIDIDILAIDDLVIEIEDKLSIPHKSLLQRDFFVKTFAEIEPNWRYPRNDENYNRKITEFLQYFSSK